MSQTGIKILPVYKDAFFDESKILLIWGGRGSGKSYFVPQKLLLRLMHEDNHKILVITRYSNKIKDRVYEQIKQVIYNAGLEADFILKTSPFEITYKGNNNRIIFYGLDDGGKIKSITGISAVWVEEATEIDYDDFTQLDLSFRGILKNYKQIILTFNPENKQHWIYQRWFKDKPYDIYQHFTDGDVSSYHTTYKDNTHVNIPEYEKQLNQYANDADRYKKDALGQWIEKSDKLIFTNYEVKDISNNPDDYEIVKAGADFGWKHASTCLLVAEKGDYLFILKEIYASELTYEKFVELIKDKVPDNTLIIADSAEPRGISLMKSSGLKVMSAKKYNGSVKDAIDYIRTKKIVIHPSCKQTIAEIGEYSYKYDAKTNIIYDEPADKQTDDAMAALRYSVNDRLKERSIRFSKIIF